MKFEVPFDTNLGYVSLINDKETIHSVYYGLERGITPNARNTSVSNNPYIDTNEMLKGLHPGIKKHLVCNGSFINPELYTSKTYRSAIDEILCDLLTKNILDGIIVFDVYFLKAIAELELIKSGMVNVIPSINFKIDSIQRFNSIVTQIRNILGYDYFPTEVMVDRSLNRDIESLKKLSSHIRNVSPKTKITLLANEGCLNHCSLKHTHDAIISYINIGHDVRCANELNRFGCLDYCMSNPSQILTSPFIRPEDLNVYSELCDVIKLSGRTLSAASKINILKAYLSRSYNGNLLDLLEAQSGNKDKFFIDNQGIKDTFINTVTSCDKACFNCNFCYNIFNEVS